MMKEILMNVLKMKIVTHPFVNPIKIIKMKYDIHKTAVVPYIVAERAVWNVLEADKRFKDATPNQMAEIVNRLNEPLVNIYYGFLRYNPCLPTFNSF